MAISSYGQEKIEDLLKNPDIIRNRLKLKAAVENSRVFLDIVAQYGCFGAYLRSFTGDIPLREHDRTVNAWSDAISADLRKRGMRFVGSTIIYAYLQAIGMIDSHEPGCDLFRGEGSDRP